MSSAGKTEPDTQSPCRVFLSYSRDDRERALTVIAALEQSGIEVWWDGLLTGGDAFLQTTESMLEGADAVVVLWTEKSVQSHWVRDEATHGRERNALVPVTLDGSKPPLGFRQIQYVNLAKWRGQTKAPEFVELLRAIEQVASTAERKVVLPAASAIKPRRAVPLLNRRTILASGGAAVVLGGVFAGWKAGLLGSGAEAGSIAVMPFRNLSADPAKAYFSDGLAEELRAMLSLNRRLEVVAQSSSNSLRDDNLDVPAIAMKLGVAFVLEGSVQAAGEQMRIIARLVDGADGFEKWSQVFERKLTDVLAVQSEIAALVTDSLVSTILVPEQIKSIRVGGTGNTKAFDAYLRGAALYELAESEQTDRLALAAFDEAIGLDRDYAVAHAGRARALTVISGAYSSGTEVARLNAEAEAAARRAVALAPDLAEGQAALGFILMNGQLNLVAARQPMELGFERGFGNANIMTAYATFSGYLGKFDQARNALVRAKRLDPLNPTVWRTSGLIEFYARNFAAAETELRAGLAKNKKLSAANRALGDMALARGDIAAAEAYFRAEPSTLSRLRGLAVTAHRRGDQIAAQKRLDELLAQFGSNSLYQQAQIYAQWGDSAKALDAMERGYVARDVGLLDTLGDPMLDPIRQDPRFAAILRQLGATGVQG